MQMLIFANGVMEASIADRQDWLRTPDLVIAADGGTHYALELGLRPDHVVGDLDSLPQGLRERLEAAGTEFHVSPPAKDETDLELALLWAAGRPGRHGIWVLGAFGGRPDQEIANLLLLALPDLAGHRVVMWHQGWEVSLIRPGEPLTLKGDPDDRVSLVPLGGDAAGVTTAGLAFGLDDEMLIFGRARGISNRLAAAEAKIRVTDGLLWCFHERLDSPSAE